MWRAAGEYLRMKTVTGRVTSEKPISLSKAATLLSSFVSSETDASQDVAAYLRRASDAFTELKSFHREIRSTKPAESEPRFGENEKRKSREEDAVEEKETVKWEEEPGKKERKKKSREEDVVEEKVDVKLEEEQRNDESKEKKKKKSKKNKGEDVNVKLEEEQRNEERKEKKKSKNNKGEDVVDEEKDDRKKMKRKSDGEIGSEERKIKKKKRKSKEIDA